MYLSPPGMSAEPYDFEIKRHFEPGENQNETSSFWNIGRQITLSPHSIEQATLVLPAFCTEKIKVHNPLSSVK